MDEPTPRDDNAPQDPAGAGTAPPTASPVSLPAYGASPPTTPGAIPQIRSASSWPTILGTGAIILAGFAVLASIFSLFTLGSFTGFVPAQNQPPLIGMAPMIKASSILAAVIALVLLFGGIQLLRRRPGSIPIIRLWAILKIAFLVGTIGFAMAQGSDASQFPATGIPPATLRRLTLIGQVASLLWGCALPVFVLVWFARLRVKEETAQWR